MPIQKKLEKFFTTETDEEEKYDASDEENYEEHPNALLSWNAPEFEVYEKDRKWYIIFVSIISAIIIYAAVSNNPIMAITFILIGIVFYIFSHKAPRTITFSVTSRSIVAGKEEYPFKNVKSFWIFYDRYRQVLSIETSSSIDPYVHFPLADTDPTALREILVKYLPEKEHDDKFIDTLQRLVRL